MWLTSTSSLKPRSSAFRLDTPLLAAMTFSLTNLRTNLRMGLSVRWVCWRSRTGWHPMCSVNVFQWYFLDSQSSEKRHTEIGCLLRCFTFGWSLNAARLEVNLFDTDLIAFAVWIKLFQYKLGHFRDKSSEVCIKQSKVNSNSAAIQKPGHWAENCKIVYCANKKNSLLFDSSQFHHRSS